MQKICMNHFNQKYSTIWTIITNIEEENLDPEDGDKDQGTTATYQTTYIPSISQRSISQKSSATTPRHEPPVPANAEVTKINAVRHVLSSPNVGTCIGIGIGGGGGGSVLILSVTR